MKQITNTGNYVAYKKHGSTSASTGIARGTSASECIKVNVTYLTSAVTFTFDTMSKETTEK